MKYFTFIAIAALLLMAGCTQEIEKPTEPGVSQNVPPVIALYVSPTTGAVNETEIIVDLDGSTDDSKIVQFTCAWGDGTADTSQAYAFAHIYEKTGLFTVYVEATDDSGAVSNSHRSVLIVAGPLNQPPLVTATVEPVMGIAGRDTIRFEAEAFDSDGVVVTQAWNFGDGMSASTAKALHVYQLPGFYEVLFRAIDDDGAFTEERRYVWISSSDSSNGGDTTTVDTTCWESSQNLRVTLTKPYKTGTLTNPQGLATVWLTVIEEHGKPDMIYAFTLVQGTTRIPFVLPDHKPNSSGVDTVRIQIPQVLYLEKNQPFELTYQDGPNSNSVTLINVEGCTYTKQK